MNEPVLLVTVNYRLGVFGFLSTASPEASGNWGLLDQRLAMVWVQENIHRFGGDPERVVIFGESAGAASVMYHYVSPGPKVQFSGVIAQSGTVLNHWSVQTNPCPYAIKLGQSLGCNTTQLGALVACLKTKSVLSIFTAILNNGWLEDTITGPFTPVLENPAHAKFIGESPYKLLKDGNIRKVPLIMGFNRDEAAFLFLGPQAAAFNNINENFFNVTQPALIYQLTKQDNLLEKSYAAKAEYWDRINVNNRTEVVRTAIEFASDGAFISGSSQTSRIVARHTKVFQYLLTRTGNVSQYNFTGHMDVMHGDDLPYLFNMSVLTPNDEKFSCNLVNMWANFARFRNPTPFFGLFNGVRWTTVGTQEKLRYLNLGEANNTMEFQSDQMVRREKLWGEIGPYTHEPAHSSCL